MAKRMVPDGVYDFGSLVSRRQDGTFRYLFVDKTMLIKEVCDSENVTFLFTRPRRFGKSINNSMMDRFFNIAYRDGPDIFEGLKIDACEECRPFRNRFPVVKLNFEMVSGRTRDEVLGSVDRMVSRSARRFKHLLEEKGPEGDPVLDETDRRILSRLISGRLSKEGMASSVSDLCEVLFDRYGEKAVVLVDEYDRCIQEIDDSAAYDATVEVLKPFMEMTFKTNDFIRTGFVTGITSVAKAGMLSGFNNPKVCDILSTEYDEYFGFTEAEVAGLLEDAEWPDSGAMGEIREWYDGYTFGRSRVYNPFSVMRYLANRKAKPYWDGSTKGGLSDSLLSGLDRRSLGRLAEMCEGTDRSMTTPVETVVAYSDLMRKPVEPYLVFSYLAMSGYLTAEEIGWDEDGELPLCKVRVPNREMLLSFGRLRRRAREDARISLYDDIASGSSDEATLDLNLVLVAQAVDSSWTHDTYKTLICGILALESAGPRAEIPKGLGRCDIFVPSRNGSPAIAIEVKTSSKDSPKSLSERAMDAIVEKGYASESLDCPVMAVGIGIKVKSACVSCKLSNGSCMGHDTD